MYLSYFCIIIGFIIGLGAVTVIDIHGFLARKSEYWTLATIRAHKITKPLIWIGTILFILGISLLYTGELLRIQLLLTAVMVLNGVFLSFKVSPYLLAQEKSDHPSQILSLKWQRRITLSFIISFLSWWSSVALFIHYLSSPLV